jgi:tRNA (guanine-N7-)-methyltransferase
MGTGQQRALEELGPRYLVPYAAQPLDAVGLFGRDAPLIVEIGFGMGHATAQIAAARRDTDFLGIEVHTPGVGPCSSASAKRAEQPAHRPARCGRGAGAHDRPRLSRGACLLSGSLAQEEAQQATPHPAAFRGAAGLAPEAGGILHCATDWQPYAEQMLEVLEAEPRLRNTAAGYAPVRTTDHSPSSRTGAFDWATACGIWSSNVEQSGKLDAHVMRA